jgi:hypothetical protein
LRGYVSQRGHPQLIQIEKKIEMMNALLDQYHDNSRKPYKMTSISINNTQQLLAAMSALEQQMANIRAQLGAVTRNKQVHAELTQMVADSSHKPKRELSAGVIAWNEQVHETLAQMKTDGWKHPQTGKEPIYRDALAEAARRLRENDPAKQAKYEAYRKVADAKTAKIQAARAAASAPAPPSAPPSAPASVTSPSEKKEKKNPWADMTEEQKAERLAKMKAGREAKKLAASQAPVVTEAPAPNPFDEAPAETASDAESAASGKKRGPPKGVKLSEEERIRRATKAKATRDAKKLAALPALPVSAPVSAASSVIVSDDEIDEETFTKQQLPNSSRIIYKNGLNHVRAYTPQGVGAWLGMYDPVKKTIDASVPEPEDE